MWLTLVAVRNAIAVLMAALAIVVLGATSLKRLSIDLFPNINQPVVTVGTIYTGANVQDIEKTVTYPIEKVVSAVPGVHHVESRSRQGISVVQVWFNYDADLNAGQNDIIQRIQQISNSLPSGIKQPFIIRADLSNIPVCLLTVSGGGFDERQLYDIAYNTIEPQIERINGVAAANVDGGKIRQIAVNLNRDLLYAKGISVLDVVRSVNDSNFLMPSGDIKIGSIDYNMFTNNQFQLVKPMEDIVVRKVGDVPVRVRDLGLRPGLLRAADQRGPRRRRARGVPARQQAAVGQHHRGRRRRARAPDQARPRAARREGRPDLRPVDLHPAVDREPLARVDPGGRARVPGHPDLPAERGLDRDHLGRDPPVDHVHADRDVLPGPDAEHLHPRRAGPRGGAPGRRLHRRAREHQPPPQHAGQGPQGGGPRCGPRGGDADLRLHHHDHRRVPADDLPGGAGEAPVHPADLHDLVLALLVVPGLADRDAPDVPPPAQALRRASGGRGFRARFMSWSQALFDGLDSAYQDSPPLGARAPQGRRARRAGHVPGEPRARPADRHRVLPDVRREPVPDHAPCTARHPRRGDREDGRPDRGPHPAEPPAGRAEVHRVDRRDPRGRSALFSGNTGPHAAQVQAYLETPDRRKRSDVQIVNAIRPRFVGEFPGSLTYFNLGGIISRVLNRGSQNPLEVEVIGYDLDDAPGVAREVARVMRDTPGVADVQISREGNYPQFNVVVDREKAATAGLSQRDVAQAALFSLNSNVSVNPSIFTDPRSGNQYNIVVQLDEPFRVRPEDLGKIFVTAPGRAADRALHASPTSGGASPRSRSSGSTSSA